MCQSIGFTEMKTANFRPSEPTENATTYLKLKDDSSPNNFKSLTGSLELSTAPCDTVEIKCSIKHRKINFKLFYILSRFDVDRAMFFFLFSVWRFWRQRPIIDGNVAISNLSSKHKNP